MKCKHWFEWASEGGGVRKVIGGKRIYEPNLGSEVTDILK